jgi:hypothetical protein
MEVRREGVTEVARQAPALTAVPQGLSGPKREPDCIKRLAAIRGE